MTGEAIALLALTILVVWGGLAASIVMLARQPENDHMPPGGEDTVVPDEPESLTRDL